MSIISMRKRKSAKVSTEKDRGGATANINRPKYIKRQRLNLLKFLGLKGSRSADAFRSNPNPKERDEAVPTQVEETLTGSSPTVIKSTRKPKGSKTLVALDGSFDRQSTPDLRNYKSPPTIAYSLSIPESLFNAYSRRTVVHKPALHRRPSVLSTVDSTSPSSNNTSASPKSVGYSTGQTSPSSEKSGGENQRADVAVNHGLPVGSKCHVVHLERIDEGSVRSNMQSSPQEDDSAELRDINCGSVSAFASIVTVESTAAAKVFFETYFNDLLTAPITPRSQRRRSLELKLLYAALSEEDRNRVRLRWAHLESQDLRQIRVHKSRSLGSTRPEGSAVSLGGYESIRVLGKGSFGLVRLVRAKTYDAHSIPHFYSSTRKELHPLAIKWAASEKQLYAMKIIRKSSMLRNTQEGHVRAERDILVASAQARWVVPLIASFQDISNLYLVMEYMVGGDFLAYLIREDVLDEAVAKWYMAEMVLCIEEAHKMRWIHRDIKPENFLISASGHLKISDFGLAFDGHWSHHQAYHNNHRYSLVETLEMEVDGDLFDRQETFEKMTSKTFENTIRKVCRLPRKPATDDLPPWLDRKERRRMARSIVGTSQYMAPEIIRGQPYDGRCDWWSLGVILYECFFGCTPFCAKDRDETKFKIMHHRQYLRISKDPRFSNELSSQGRRIFYPASEEARALMKALLQDRELRLSSSKYASQDVHRLLSGISASTSLDGVGDFVHANDADDIKAHPFFRGIHWEYLHLTRPPFCPDTDEAQGKYFDTEEQILADDNFASSSFASAMGALDVYANEEEIRDALSPEHYQKYLVERAAERVPERKGRVAGKERKRPRDKLLRDTRYKKIVLEKRKQGAFLGYTWRRPMTLDFPLDGLMVPVVPPRRHARLPLLPLHACSH